MKLSNKTKNTLKKAGIRAARTAIQTTVACVGTATVIQEVNWLVVLSTVGLSTFVAFLMGILTGLPEVEEE